MGHVVGFKRNFKFETSECGQNKTWLMIEYNVADSFFKENIHIVKENCVVCRIKKKMNKEKNVDHVMEAQDGDVVGIIDPLLLNLIMITPTTMEKRGTTLEVQQGQRSDDIRNDEFHEDIITRRRAIRV
ncbi:hypothetical protein H5410_015585 [Solanum commersonii]|uniref:NAC domain-containing protein n=1 Tax=Solanum commersonii TaxID=4109 RepID=A0A9J5ZU63_SOLCO|nr:hypothetical protein H5410_015585 [Solanum commersonii]